MIDVVFDFLDHFAEKWLRATDDLERNFRGDNLLTVPGQCATSPDVQRDEQEYGSGDDAVLPSLAKPSKKPDKKTDKEKDKHGIIIQ